MHAAAQLVRTSDQAGVRTLVLNRPQQLNAFNQALCWRLTEAITEASEDDDVRVVVLTGAGRAFSAGTDLLELAATGDFRGDVTDDQRFDRLIDAISAFRKPLVIAVNGIAVGLGVTLLGHADLVLMSDTARLRCPFTNLALAPEAGASLTLPMLIGRQAASWLLLSSEWIEAADALAWGLAWRVVPGEDLLGEAQCCAGRIAAKPLASLIESKRLILAGSMEAVSQARRRENAVFDVLLQSDESRTAVGMFVAGRRSGDE